MGRHPTSGPKVQRPAQLGFDELKLGIQRLRRRIEEIESFALGPDRDETQARASALRAAIEDSLVQTFGHDTVDYDRYQHAIPMDYAAMLGEAEFGRRKAHALALLRQAVALLEERLADISIPIVGVVGKDQEMADSRKVFVVHGRDTGARESVARFLERAGFEPIVLHEQANQGRTVIEKIEEHSAVRFAVVLLTPDDVGSIAGETLKPRARQNVILELGYFIAKLGRDRVCALKSGDIELPSDILGVVWTSFDENGGWRASLAKELQAAGFEIDWNKVMA